MSSPRWQHLDRSKREPTTSPNPPAAAPDGADLPPGAPAAGGSPSHSPSNHAALRTARGYYHLRQFQACADAVEAALETDPSLPGAQRLLGMALGCLGEPNRAAEALARGCEEDPSDLELRASLVSAQMGQGAVPPSIPHLPGRANELKGAAAWLRGQQQLRDGDAHGAAGSFFSAAHFFAEASPLPVLGERIAACYVGLAISHLLTGMLDAAQGDFSRLSGRGSAPQSALAFARQVYEVADAVRELSPEEQRDALAPLAELVLQVRLHVRYYDGTGPVAMHWENLP